MGAIDRLFQDFALRKRLGCAARADALANYTWDRVSIPIREAYERLGANRTPRIASACVEDVQKR